MKKSKNKIIVLIFIFISLAMLHLIPFRTVEKTITVQNTERSYFLHLPSDYDSSQQYPLVIMLHGYSDHPLLMELYSGMSKKADKEKFIVVYPKGSHDEYDKNLSWNAEFCCGGARRQNSDDVAFIDKLLDELSAKYAFDTDRVYVAGFSNGAMFAHMLGTQLTTRITAIAAISGTVGGDGVLLTKPDIPLPILIMNGTADETIPFSGGGSYASAQETVDFWKSNNKTTQEREYNEKLYKKTIYSDSTGKNEVVFYEIENGTHLWFGRKREFLNILFNQSVFTTDEVWNFFKKY